MSLYVDHYQYTGGAHGGIARRGYTFDLKTGKLLTLKAAAADHPDYVTIINRTIQEQIKDTDLPLITPFDTIKPDRDYYLSHEGVVIYFQPYEYTAYAAGMPEFRDYEEHVCMYSLDGVAGLSRAFSHLIVPHFIGYNTE